jgi:hypothetical protein
MIGANKDSLPWIGFCSDEVINLPFLYDFAFGFADCRTTTGQSRPLFAAVATHFLAPVDAFGWR